MIHINKALALLDIEQRIIQWKLQTKTGVEQPIFNVSRLAKLKWTGTAADLVEFAYGALETKRLNKGDIDINLLIEQLCFVFSFEVKDCYDTFRAIRRRVGSRTLFLDDMKEKLNERMDDMDNGIFKKKKIRR